MEGMPNFLNWQKGFLTKIVWERSDATQGLWSPQIRQCGSGESMGEGVVRTAKFQASEESNQMVAEFRSNVENISIGDAL